MPNGLQIKLVNIMKKQINDLLLKMQTGENCIGETANHLLNLFGVVSSYVILYNNGDYEHFDGELTKAIEHLKEDRRYSNYGHNGAVLFKGKKVYSIADERTETFFT